MSDPQAQFHIYLQVVYINNSVPMKTTCFVYYKQQPENTIKKIFIFFSNEKDLFFFFPHLKKKTVLNFPHGKKKGAGEMHRKMLIILFLWENFFNVDVKFYLHETQYYI